jgi:DnaJ family protein B protein 13
MDKTDNFGGLAGRGKKKQDPPIERDLMLSLEEVFHGCIKKMKISRKVMNDDGHTSSFKEKILTITVKRGWQPGTRITFEREGDQGPNNVPSDIVFIVRDKPHKTFRRDLNANLIYTQPIPLALALIGTTIHVPTLDGRVLDLPITDVVRPGFTRTIPGEGMPLVDDPKHRGDLIVEFDIEFPRYLTPDSKELVRRALVPGAAAAYQKKEELNKQRSLARAKASGDYDDDN